MAIRYVEAELNDGALQAPKPKLDNEGKRQRTIARLRKRLKPEKMDALDKTHLVDGSRDQAPRSLSEQQSGPRPGVVERRRGRPIAPKPWLDAGVSRMTWYRRRKAQKDKSE